MSKHYKCSQQRQKSLERRQEVVYQEVEKTSDVVFQRFVERYPLRRDHE